MRTVSYSAFGKASAVLELADIEMPEPTENEVVVELRFSGVNPSDVKARAGRPGMTKPAFETIVPHSDGAGIITSVGSSVSKDRIGQRVWIWNGQWQRPFGTASSHIVLDQTQAVPLSDGVSFEVGAVLGIPGLTAAHAVFGHGEISGSTILIQGGAGTVGLLAVQLAKWGGAKVITTCSAQDIAHCLSIGADHAFDYKDTELVSKVLEANKGNLIDRVVEVEFGLNIASDVALIKSNGIIAAYGSAKSLNPHVPFFEMLFKAVTLDIILIYLLPLKERLSVISRLNQALSDNALTCPIAKIFPINMTSNAHELVESGARDGAVLIDVFN
jgi:NADPH2:quinone reductase